jgi:hypothetical protein
MPSSLQYPLDRARDLQRKWGRLIHELSPCTRSIEPRINPPPQSVWLLAIGNGLKFQYDEVLGAPLPPQLVALLGQLDTQGAIR